MAEVRIVDVVDVGAFGLVPPCADPGFDHRTCDYWEDADRGSKAARLSWLEREAAAPTAPPTPRAVSPFAVDPPDAATNPFAPSPPGGGIPNPFARAGDLFADNPFAPRRPSRPTVDPGAPPKLRLLSRGLGVFGTYAKVLLVDGDAVGYTQFGPLSAYPRAQRTRVLYPQLPDAPLPAVITCIATTSDARRRGWAKHLVEEVCRDLAGRGFSAVETYPEVAVRENATPAASPRFWEQLGFVAAAPDERYPVMRRELG